MTTRRALAHVLCGLLAAGCASAVTRQAPAAGPVTPPAGGAAGAPAPLSRGFVLARGAGERLTYCGRPLVLTLKVDSANAPTSNLLAGVGELRGDEGIGRHRTADEVIYIAAGWGHVVVGADTVRFGPGSVMYVPPDTPHRLVGAGAEPVTYFFAMSPASSAAGFRRAAQLGCPDTAAGGSAPAPGAAAREPMTTGRALAIAAGDGERITYCAFPLTITAKIDTDAAPGARLMAATGALRRGVEYATHPEVDEIVFVTHGRGRAFTGGDTVAIAPGSVVFTPRGVPHGLINDGAGTLEYLVLFGRSGSRAGYRRLAARAGPYCPPGVP